ncbi:hypothetical protein CMV_010900 [Castanea mollissima]|uniref:Uncharacterized protein n=1 Tax=Castanea mollissima TaxID=60419 RepID=A0A8J4W0F3_9ROSI|nr:hypothetical protein CMV_010900 [Castanea mollissima]
MPSTWEPSKRLKNNRPKSRIGWSFTRHVYLIYNNIPSTVRYHSTLSNPTAHNPYNSVPTPTSTLTWKPNSETTTLCESVTEIFDRDLAVEFDFFFLIYNPNIHALHSRNLLGLTEFC